MKLHHSLPILKNLCDLFKSQRFLSFEHRLEVEFSGELDLTGTADYSFTDSPENRTA